MDIDPRLLVDLGVGGFAVYALAKTTNWFAQQFMLQVTTHNKEVIEEVKRVADAVRKNTEQTTFLLLALVGKDIVEIRGKEAVAQMHKEAEDLANGKHKS